ncbi:MAG: hypothetical protein KatS3mg105_4989 [Gemmatales bacterium]|nr:MAG: hypothetical protein KatS3mg105_4989 [Gemmatales bacterium]
MDSGERRHSEEQRRSAALPASDDHPAVDGDPQRPALDPQLIGHKEQRKLKARREQGRSVWYNLGMFGLVGWSIAIPTLIGIAVGMWIDRTWHPPFSCTLMCLFVGVVVGCWIAWYWIKRESGHE